MHEGGVALLLGHGRRREVGGEGRLLGHRIDPILRTSSGDRKLQGNGCLINPSPVQDNPQDYIYISRHGKIRWSWGHRYSMHVLHNNISIISLGKHGL